MATESGSDSQLRRRRRRDPEGSEKTELSEREPALAVAGSEENDDENEERWVGPLPVEATLAKKRKGSGGEPASKSDGYSGGVGGLISSTPAVGSEIVGLCT